jgi:signal transduction histidine kinase
MRHMYFDGSYDMRKRWKDEAARAKREFRKAARDSAPPWGRRHRPPPWGPFDWDETEPPEPPEPPGSGAIIDPKERALRDAERTADRKVALYRDIAVAVAIVAPLLWFLTPVGVIALFIFGIRLVKRYFSLMVAPELRKKFVEEEIEKRVDESVTRQRRDMQGRHARSLEQLSASIAHEIRNPITAAKSLVQQMGEEPAAAENVQYARVALEELERVEKSISHLLRYARDEELQMNDIRLSEVIDSALESFRDRASRKGIEMAQQIDSQGEMRADPEKLRRVVINLVGNAMDALEEAGVEKPRILISSGENLAGNEVWLRVRDNGPGMDSEAQAKIFNPFYTSKSGGTGLGLAITRKIVEAHGGEIEIASEPGKGAQFVVTFPKQPPPPRESGEAQEGEVN